MLSLTATSLGLRSLREVLQDLLAPLPLRHRIALEWFYRHAGTEQPWPAGIESAEGVILLATRAKGIYKPAGSDYALSARQALKSRYPEKGPIYRDDGTWLYGYFQENEDPGERDTEFTNRALLRCLQDSVPIGVMRQTRPKPLVRYEILGLALVSSWDGGYFFFEGFARDGVAHPAGMETEVELLSVTQERSAVENHAFDPEGIVDARERAFAQIIRRRGQKEFREKLLVAYEGRCAVTGCDATEALEAAHIVPYRGHDTNKVQNGLLLRADIHTLFDLGLIAISSEPWTVIIGASLAETKYGGLAGVQVCLPSDPQNWPSPEALVWHREWAGL